MGGLTEKICTSCGQIKLACEFYQNVQSKTGLSSHCKACRRIRQGQNKLKKIKYLPENKQCPGCKLYKNQSEFTFSSRNPDGLSYYCRMCDRKSRIKSRFGIDYTEYENLLTRQNGVCVICGNPETAKDKNGLVKPLSVDHDHKTGQIRGLLCDSCNNLLGNAKDNPETLRKAADYLERNQ